MEKDEFTNKKVRRSIARGSISVYIHWPFCAQKCPYCAFNSYAQQNIDVEAWKIAYQKAIQHYAPVLYAKTVASIFFGGGTPSLAPTDIIANIVETIANIANVTAKTEISIECNPTSVEISKFRNLKNAGINRISLGIQSLNDRDLKFLGRNHDVKIAMDTIQAAGTIFNRYSIDLIYCLPGQDLRSWKSELRQACILSPQHLSLYQLSIEPNTPFDAKVRKKKIHPASSDLAATFYEVTQEITDAAGMLSYEVSNHASKDEECVHNLVYWLYGDFIGIGPGAHGRITANDATRKIFERDLHPQEKKIAKDGALANKIATVDYKSPQKWLEAVSAKNFGVEETCCLNKEATVIENLIMNMRLSEGIDISAIPSQKNVRMLVNMGLLSISGKNIKTTLKGRLILDNLLQYLVE